MPEEITDEIIGAVSDKLIKCRLKIAKHLLDPHFKQKDREDLLEVFIRFCLQDKEKSFARFAGLEITKNPLRAAYKTGNTDNFFRDINALASRIKEDVKRIVVDEQAKLSKGGQSSGKISLNAGQQLTSEQNLNEKKEECIPLIIEKAPDAKDKVEKDFQNQSIWYQLVDVLVFKIIQELSAIKFKETRTGKLYGAVCFNSDEFNYKIGNCLFDAISKFTDQNSSELRRLAVERIQSDAQLNATIEALATGDEVETLRLASGRDSVYRSAKEYFVLMRLDKTWGTAIEVIALARVLKRPIVIITPNNEFDQIVEESTYKDGEPILLNYLGGNHYEPLKVPKGETAFAIIARVREARKNFESKDRKLLHVLSPQKENKSVVRRRLFDDSEKFEKSDSLLQTKEENDDFIELDCDDSSSEEDTDRRVSKYTRIKDQESPFIPAKHESRSDYDIATAWKDFKKGSVKFIQSTHKQKISEEHLKYSFILHSLGIYYLYHRNVNFIYYQEKRKCLKIPVLSKTELKSMEIRFISRQIINALKVLVIDLYGNFFQISQEINLENIFDQNSDRLFAELDKWLKKLSLEELNILYVAKDKKPFWDFLRQDEFLNFLLTFVVNLLDLKKLKLDRQKIDVTAISEEVDKDFILEFSIYALKLEGYFIDAFVDDELLELKPNMRGKLCSEQVYPYFNKTINYTREIFERIALSGSPHRKKPIVELLLWSDSSRLKSYFSQELSVFVSKVQKGRVYPDNLDSLREILTLSQLDGMAPLLFHKFEDFLTLSLLHYRLTTHFIPVILMEDKEFNKMPFSRTCVIDGFTYHSDRQLTFFVNLRLANRSQHRRIKNLQNADTFIPHINLAEDENKKGRKLLERTTAIWQFRDLSSAFEEKIISHEKSYNQDDRINNLGTYQQIYEKIRFVLTQINLHLSEKITDASLASWVKAIFDDALYESMDEMTQKKLLPRELDYLSNLVSNLYYLFFGCEAARNPAMHIANHMVLDLIVCEKISWEDALFPSVEGKLAVMPMAADSKKARTAASRRLSEAYSKYLPYPYYYGGTILGEGRKEVAELIRQESAIMRLWLEEFFPDMPCFTKSSLSSSSEFLQPDEFCQLWDLLIENFDKRFLIEETYLSGPYLSGRGCRK